MRDQVEIERELASTQEALVYANKEKWKYKDRCIELEKKLYEEYNEVLNTKNTEERIEELADMIEIISSLALVEGKNLDVVLECAKKKCIKRGGFEKKIYLEKVIED